MGLFVFIINYEETLVLIYGIQTTIYYYNPSAISKKILPLLFSEQPKRITIGSLLNPTPAQLASPSTSNAELGGQAVSTAAISPEKAFKKECEAAHENAKLRLKPGEKLINANSANPIDHILTIEKQIDIAHEKAKTMLKDGDRLINSSSLKPADHISYSRKLADDNTPLLGKSLIEWNLSKNKTFDIDNKSDYLVAAKCLEYLYKIDNTYALTPKDKTFDASLYQLVKNTIENKKYPDDFTLQRNKNAIKNNNKIR